MSDCIVISLFVGIFGDVFVKFVFSVDDFFFEVVIDCIMGFIIDCLCQEKVNGVFDFCIQDFYNQVLKGVESGLCEVKNIMQGLGIFSGEIKNNFDNIVNMIVD